MRSVLLIGITALQAAPHQDLQTAEKQELKRRLPPDLRGDSKVAVRRGQAEVGARGREGAVRGGEEVWPGPGWRGSTGWRWWRARG